MGRTYCRILGIATLLLGIAGFVTPHLMGFHLTAVHNVIHLATGAIASWVGFAGMYDACRTFCRVFGVVYGVIAVLGLVAPGLLGTILGHPGLSATELMPDNILHLVITLTALGAGFAPGAEARVTPA
jgi:hypothetical protein